jgi:hypothetical protein
MVFAIADLLAGIVIGAVTAVGVGTIVHPGTDMVLGMLAGMVMGVIIHLVVGLALAPLIGMFEAMVPAALIGMYGGMLFGMRDAMGAGSQTIGANITIGALFGAIVVAGVSYYDRTLRGVVVDTGEQPS